MAKDRRERIEDCDHVVFLKREFREAKMRLAELEMHAADVGKHQKTRYGASLRAAGRRGAYKTARQIVERLQRRVMKRLAKRDPGQE